MSEKTQQQGFVEDIIVDHEIHGVEPYMIDWWWDNMEKGYPLWCPGEHKSFVWQIAPATNGHVGALQIAEESINFGPVMKIPIRWAHTSEVPDLPIFYEHILVSSTPTPEGKYSGQFLTHQYEATSYGTRMHSIMHWREGFPKEFGEAWAKHNKSEVKTFPDFLPQLYKIWQVVKDPAINVPCCLKYPYKDINKKRKD
jgi:hypothetical protein